LTPSNPAFALSVVVPVFNGAASLPGLAAALSRLEVPGGMEIVLVNDGSSDNSLEVCRAICRQNDAAVTVVNLARNFGEHNAVMAGLGVARGEYVITMDDDLQNPPEEVLRLFRHTAENGFDVVYTHYAMKQHGAWRNFGSAFANWCAGWLLDKPKDLYLSSFRCMSGLTVASILEHTGPYPYIDGLILQATQNIGRLQVAHLERAEGRSNYTLRRLMRLFFAMFFNFSVMPLRIATVGGALMALLGLCGFVAVIVEALGPGTPSGWASLMSATLLLSGVQLVMLGMLGEYLGRMFLAINGKPQFVVREVHRSERAAQAPTRAA